MTLAVNAKDLGGSDHLGLGQLEPLLQAGGPDAVANGVESSGAFRMPVPRVVLAEHGIVIERDPTGRRSGGRPHPPG